MHDEHRQLAYPEPTLDEFGRPVGSGRHEAPSPKQKRGAIRETVRFAFIALLVVIPFRIFIAQPFIVSGASMDPTFHHGEYLIVDQLSYRFEEPARGDVIIFRYPRDPSKYFIKRIIGMPGETVSVRDGGVFITPASSTQTYALEEPYVKNDGEMGRIPPVTLGATEYFVMGDNRPASSDSRVWGPLQRRLIVGTPLVRLLPVTLIDFRPGLDDVSRE